MALEIDQTSAGDRVHLQMRRGEDLSARFELYASGGAPGSCSEPVLGPPLDLSGYSGVVSSGRIEGTDRPLLVRASLVDKGALDRPAILALFVSHLDVEAVFDEGAYQSFCIEVVAERPGNRISVLAARVDVEDSAFGALA